jgi:hypothetical protein
VERTLLCVAFVRAFDHAEISTAASTTVEERRFSFSAA